MNDGISKNKTILLSFLLACLGMVFALFADKSSVNYLVQSFACCFCGGVCLSLKQSFIRHITADRLHLCLPQGQMTG